LIDQRSDIAPSTHGRGFQCGASRGGNQAWSVSAPDLPSAEQDEYKAR
jgi:hypothetical protein